MSQKNIMKAGDLVWYNVGAHRYTTMGLVIEVATLWDSTSTWQPQPEKYSNCIRIQWMRKGKLVPKCMHLPLFRSWRSSIDSPKDYGTFYPEGHTAFTPPESLISHGAEWYEGRFFKVVGSADTRRR